jgi:hypothetical protein
MDAIYARDEATGARHTVGLRLVSGAGDNQVIQTELLFPMLDAAALFSTSSNSLDRDNAAALAAATAAAAAALAATRKVPTAGTCNAAVSSFSSGWQGGFGGVPTRGARRNPINERMHMQKPLFASSPLSVWAGVAKTATAAALSQPQEQQQQQQQQKKKRIIITTKPAWGSSLQ